MDQITIPDGFRPLETQVAGHTFQTETATLGLLQTTQTGCVVFKPMGKPECGEREHNFYEQVQNAKDEVCSRARSFVPRFYDKVTLCVNERNRLFLKLENVTYGLQKPCIIDIKVGSQTWDPLATAEKRAYEDQKYARCKVALGLCLPGMQVYKISGCELVRHGREFGKQLDPDGFRDAIRYFLNAEQNVCETLVREILSQLYSIRSWFGVQTMFRFYASSLLIAYDFDALRAHLRSAGRHIANGNTDIVQSSNGLTPRSEHNASESKSPSSCPQYSKQWVKVKMIDFAHVFPAVDNGLDKNYMFGLINLISILENLTTTVQKFH